MSRVTEGKNLSCGNGLGKYQLVLSVSIGALSLQSRNAVGLRADGKV